jgi:[acyl-carrier-protein] S-malonyltransferase
MRRCSFLFPGQGAQYVGMGRDLVERFPEARALLGRAESLLGLPLGEVMFSGPEEKLNEDFVSQVSVYTVSCMVADILATKSMRAAAFAPYSSGIYAAAYAAGVVDFETGLALMQEADSCIHAANTSGGMGVVLGLPLAEVEGLCDRVSGVVEVSIVNTNHQIIVSGERAAVDELLRRAVDAGALKADWLSASAPYHCSLLAPADKCLAKKIAEKTMNEPHTAIISYIDHKPLESAVEVAELLAVQLRSQVAWVGIVEELVRRNLAPMIEIGPGQMLGRSVRWIHRQAQVQNTDTAAALDDVVEILRNEQ